MAILEFKKEKTKMPDGRYLIYYNFEPNPGFHQADKKKDNQSSKPEENDHV